VFAACDEAVKNSATTAIATQEAKTTVGVVVMMVRHANKRTKE